MASEKTAVRITESEAAKWRTVDAARIAIMAKIRTAGGDVFAFQVASLDDEVETAKDVLAVAKRTLRVDLVDRDREQRELNASILGDRELMGLLRQLVSPAEFRAEAAALSR